MSNYQTLCRKHNGDKGSKTIDYRGTKFPTEQIQLKREKIKNEKSITVFTPPKWLHDQVIKKWSWQDYLDEPEPNFHYE